MPNSSFATAATVGVAIAVGVAAPTQANTEPAQTVNGAVASVTDLSRTTATPVKKRVIYKKAIRQDDGSHLGKAKVKVVVSVRLVRDGNAATAKSYAVRRSWAVKQKPNKAMKRSVRKATTKAKRAAKARAIRKAEARHQQRFPDTPPDDQPTSDLILKETFTGTAIDESRWQMYNNTYGDGNNELACLTPDNISVGQGVATITARQESVVCPGGKSRQYSSGFLGSRETGSYYPLFGRYEVRAKIPHGQGLWPAFWLRHREGANVAEIDVMEYFYSQVPGKTTSTVHFPTTLGYNVAKQSTFVETPVPGTGGWHVYAVEIAPDGEDIRFTFSIDNQQTFSYLNRDHRSWSSVDPDQTWDIALNLAVGGNWVGHPSQRLGYLAHPNKCSLTYQQPPSNDPSSCPTTGLHLANFDAEFQIDYVKVTSLQPGSRS